MIAADRFFLDAVGSKTTDPEGKPLSEVLGESPADAEGGDPLAAMGNRENKRGSIETERTAPDGGKRTLKVDYSRTKLEGDVSAIFMTVEALPSKKPPDELTKEKKKPKKR